MKFNIKKVNLQGQELKPETPVKATPSQPEKQLVKILSMKEYLERKGQK